MLLYLYADEVGISYSNINANSGASESDESVDALMKARVPHTGETRLVVCSVQEEIKGAAVGIAGWFSAPTIWQVKASHNSVLNEILGTLKKAESDKKVLWQYLSDGYGYRLCVCLPLNAVGGGTRKKGKPDWEKEINAQMPPGMPGAMVLDAGDQAAWASRYPSLQRQFFGRDIGGSHFSEWQSSVTAITHTLVPIPTWGTASQAVKEHLDLNQVPCNRDVLFTVRGESGVGKSRMVYEVIAGSVVYQNLAIYFDASQSDAEVIKAANKLHQDPRFRAIMIIDDCSVLLQSKLRSLLIGDTVRIRVVAIDSELSDSGPTYSGDNSMRLRKMTNEEIEAILKANFPDVPALGIVRAVDKCGGIIRLAADMCRYGVAATERIEEYFQNRLSPQDQQVVELISISARVGFRDELAEELNLLCSIKGIDPNEVKLRANKLRVSGFIAQAGRYYYIPAKIIAEIAFRRAWADLSAAEVFVPLINHKVYPLIESILQWVAAVGTSEAREDIGRYFADEFDSLGPDSLSSPDLIHILVLLAKVYPHPYMRILHSLVDKATPEQLPGAAIPNSRQDLVWLLERLAYNPDLFGLVEQTLLKLALHETEHRYSNNSTDVWRHLFRIGLSGTNIPFLKRLARLESHLFSPDEHISELALPALDKALDFYTTRVAVPADGISGEALEDWRPKTYGELKECWEGIFSLLEKLIASGNERLYAAASGMVTKHSLIFLKDGWLEHLKSLLSKAVLSDEQRLRLIYSANLFLKPHTKDNKAKNEKKTAYWAEVEQWSNTLKPADNDFHGQLVLVTAGSWYGLFDEHEDWQDAVRSLADLLWQKQNELKAALTWLRSDRARDAWLLGQEIGKKDKDATLLTLIADPEQKYGSSGFMNGYIQGLISNDEQHRASVSQILDEFEHRTPTVAVELSMAVEQSSAMLERMSRIVRAGVLPSGYLANFFFRISDDVSARDFRTLLELLLWAKEGEQPIAAALSQVVTIIVSRLHNEKQKQLSSVLEDEDVLLIIWKLIEETERLSYADGYWLPDVYMSLAKKDLARAARAATAYIVAENHVDVAAIATTLVQMSQIDPDIVMSELGQVMLKARYASFFHSADYMRVFSQIPTETVISWIRSNGVEAARLIAVHLAPPYLLPDGGGGLHPLTESVLREYGDDEHVFSAFHASTGTSGFIAGGLASYYRNRAEVASKFLDSDIPAMQKWAHGEREYCLRQADIEEQRGAEFHLRWG